MALNWLKKRRQKKAEDTTAFLHTPEVEQAIDRALEAHQAGRLQEAEVMYRAILAPNPNHPMALHYLGILAGQAGRPEQGIELIRKALAVMPDYEEAYGNLATLLLKMNRPEDAALAYESAAKLSPQNADVQSNLGRVLCELGRLEEAVTAFQNAITLQPDVAVHHNNLGSAHQRLGRPDRALASYRKAEALDPGLVMVYQNLANVFREKGDMDQAIAALQKAADIAPDLASVRHNLDALLGKTPDHAPQAYVEELFDPFAGQFETHLVKKLEYNMPALLKKTLVTLGLTEGKYSKVVDLGCGTGLVGVAFKDMAKTLIGVDLSKNMIHQAEAKGVYQQLFVDDLIGGLARAGDGVDLFLCADVFVYIGNLTDTFKAVKTAAAPHAVFAFSTEHAESGAYTLQDTSRYAHSKAYIEGLCAQFGFRLAHFETTNLRKEKSGWIPGGLYVLRLE